MATTKTKSTPTPKTTRSAKAAPSRSTKKTTKATKPSSQKPVETTETQSSSASETPSRKMAMPNLRVRRRTILLGLIAIALIGLAVYYRSVFVVAMVNGQPVSRLSYIEEVEAVYIPEARVTAGKQALNQLVTKTMILQEAKKKNITVSDKEVEDQIAEVRKNLQGQGQKLEDALALQGDNIDAYKARIKIQKTLEKLVGKITVSDQEVTTYIEQNKEALPQDLAEAELKSQVKSSLEQQKFNEKVQALIQNLQKNAKVNYFIAQ